MKTLPNFSKVSLKESLTKLLNQIDSKSSSDTPLSPKPGEPSKDLAFSAGLPPFMRGPYPTMYLSRPWTIRQYAGFSTARETNAYYKKCLANGQLGLSVAFDLPTHRGYDSDHERVFGDIGKAGVAIDSVDDMKLLFADIPLDQVSVSMTMNGAVAPIMAFYLVAAEESGIDYSCLSGTIQNDILKEFMVRNTYIYPPEPSLRIVGDLLKFCALEVPKFKAISVSGYHMQEAGATPLLEMTYTLANGLEYLKTGLALGLDVDHLAPQISFFWGLGMDFFSEIAKLRAARILWARIVKRFNPQQAKSMALRTHCQTSGWSLTEQDSTNNISRTLIEGLAGVLGQTQSLHTNSLDEAIALPSDSAAQLALQTQLFLRHETGVCDSIDPLAGCYKIEDLTSELVEEGWQMLQEIEQLGGMTKLIETGLPKMKIEEAATRRQAQIDSGEEKIIGVNHYRAERDSRVEVREIDNSAVRSEQIEKLKQLKQNRDSGRVRELLDTLREAARDPKQDLLSICLEAARARATLGEISLALEDVFGRYQPKRVNVSGIYSKEFSDLETINQLIARTETFAIEYGRRPRILIVKLGQDGHDRGAKVIASAYADLGFDVDIGPLFQTPEEAAKQAVENDVHVVGVSSLAGAHKSLVPKLIETLNSFNRSDIKVVVGGVIPTQDYETLKGHGVQAIFGPGTVITEAAKRILELLEG